VVCPNQSDRGRLVGLADALDSKVRRLQVVGELQGQCPALTRPIQEQGMRFEHDGVGGHEPPALGVRPSEKIDGLRMVDVVAGIEREEAARIDEYRLHRA
jgi:hypothetical protein